MNWRRLVGLGGPPPDSTGLGPDFPGQAGDRERAKFRESDYARLTTVAVADDDGQPVAIGTNDLLAELVHEIKLLRSGLVLQGMAADIDEPL